MREIKKNILNMFKIFKQTETTLFNGKIVKEGDVVSFVDSDGCKHYGIIKRRRFDCIHADTKEVLKKGTLYYWNNKFNPCDYRNADVVHDKNEQKQALIDMMRGDEELGLYDNPKSWK